MTKAKATVVVPEAAVSGVVPTPASAKWATLVEKFASTTNLGVEVVGPKLKSLAGSDDDVGVELLENVADTPDADVKALFSNDGVALARLNKAIREMRAAPAATTSTGTSVNTGNASTAFSPVVLPVVPDDNSFLDALKAGGVAKVNGIDVVAAAQVLLADTLGVYGIEATVSDKILERYEELGEPCPEIYYGLRKEVNRRSYAEVLNALGASGTDMSQAAKSRLLQKVKPLYGNLRAFQNRLEGWWDSWMAQGQNPALMMQALMTMGSGMANPLAQMAQQPPDTSAVISAQEGLIDTLNGMFGGTGKVVARAMAADALTTRKTLENPELIGAIGASSREEMLKKLGLAVSSDIVRANRDVSQYIFGVMELGKKSTAELPAYIVALMTLGKQIPWETLGQVKPNSSASRPLPGSTVFGENRKY